jgi:hypothetical protein
MLDLNVYMVVYSIISEQFAHFHHAVFPAGYFSSLTDGTGKQTVEHSGIG